MTSAFHIIDYCVASYLPVVGVDKISAKHGSTSHDIGFSYDICRVFWKRNSM